MNQHTWAPDWTSQLLVTTRKHGYQSLTELLESQPCKSYSELAGQIGEWVAPIQVISQQFKEARATGCIRDAAKDCLLRNLIEQFPNGWGGDDASWKSIKALAAWQSEVTVTGSCAEFEDTVRAIAKTLYASPPPDGWYPSNLNDPYIEGLFVRLWPVS